MIRNVRFTDHRAIISPIEIVFHDGEEAWSITVPNMESQEHPIDKRCLGSACDYAPAIFGPGSVELYPNDRSTKPKGVILRDPPLVNGDAITFTSPDIPDVSVLLNEDGVTVTQGNNTVTLTADRAATYARWLHSASEHMLNINSKGKK